MPIDQRTFDFLREQWRVEGGPAASADLAAAIAFAESGGCQYALAGPIDIRPVKTCTWNQTHGENSCGYWQINLWAHPSYRAPAIFGVEENTRAAIAISSHGSDFGAWTTYVHGAYKPYLAKFGGQPVPGPPSPPTTVEGPDPSNLNALNGWAHLSDELGRRAPGLLTSSARYREATLRLLASRTRVRR